MQKCDLQVLPTSAGEDRTDGGTRGGGTFDSLLFRLRTGLCRNTICLVDRLPSLKGLEKRKKSQVESGT